MHNPGIARGCWGFPGVVAQAPNPGDSHWSGAVQAGAAQAGDQDMAAPGSQQRWPEALVVLGHQSWGKSSASGAVAPQQTASVLLFWAGSAGWFCPLGTEMAWRHGAPL